jgi:D-alanyl-D-alanine carboxypeptidase
MRHALFLVLSAALAGVPSVSLAQAAPIPTAAIDADMNAAVARHQVAGMTIAIIRGGKIVYERAYGMRDAAQRVPATIATDYQIGSITKQFTAAAVMQLVEQGKIDLNARVSAYLPSAPHAGEITVRQLLDHTSGLADYLSGQSVMSDAGKPATYAQLIARIAHDPLQFTPGSRYAYSNTNYLLLGRIVSVVAGIPYKRYLFDRVIARAPGANFVTIADQARLPQMATGYLSGKPAPLLDATWAGPAGELVGSVADLAAWDDALLNGRVVSAASYAAMTAVQTPPDTTTPYGFALIVDHYDGQPRIWHNGGTFGFNASDQFYPNENTRIIVLTNDAAGLADALAQKIFDDCYPALAAAARAPATGEDRALTARAKAALLGLLAGRIDRSQYDAAANRGLTDRLIAQAAAQFKPLGTPSAITYRGCTQLSGGRVCKYAVTFPAQPMVLTIGIDPDGKFNEIYLGDQ